MICQINLAEKTRIESIQNASDAFVRRRAGNVVGLS